MADKSWIGPVVSAVSSLGSGLVGSIMQKRENSRQRDYEREMYEKNKQDNLAFWNMENQYNMPEMQMARFKNAGLNPHLIYGNGTSAQGASLETAKPNLSNSTKTVNPLEKVDLGNDISMMYNLRKQDAQTELLRAQVETQGTVQALNALTALYTAARTDTERQTLQPRIDELVAKAANLGSQTRLNMASEENTRANTVRVRDENNRQNKMQGFNIKEKLQNIAESRSRIQSNYAHINLAQSQTRKNEIDTLISKIDYEYKKATRNASPNASGINKFIDEGLDGLKDTEESLVQFLQNIYKKLKK